jgi:hypothetical protein
MIVFGSYNVFSQPLNDLWGLSLASTPTWSRIVPAGTAPDPGWEHTAIYDPLRDRMIVFGAYDHVERNDVCELSLAGTPQWTELFPAGTPPGPRYEHASVYDSVSDRMLVFAGYFDEVWALSADPPAWTQLFPVASLPSSRFSASAVDAPHLDGMADMRVPEILTPPLPKNVAPFGAPTACRPERPRSSHAVGRRIG